MGYLGIDVETWKIIATLVAALLGGGIVSYFTLPVMLEKARAEIRKMNIEADSEAIKMAREATELAQENRKEYNDIRELLQGDLVISGKFSMEQIIKNGSAQFQGTVTRVNRISTTVD